MTSRNFGLMTLPIKQLSRFLVEADKDYIYIFARDIEIKRYFWAMSHGCLKANQGKLLTKHRVPWFVVR